MKRETKEMMKVAAHAAGTMLAGIGLAVAMIVILLIADAEGLPL